ncbi:stage V sporulation protein AA [Paenibacillus sp. J31TS4]|uniref:stage V sporulation protein AA n=1 Tax=Paenibacillus sp. J31TS4 TaxID=2807195 RepID=UPI001B1A8817|nr:stage V sporulation protein AA [Paenibacillus sp. J31TS4]GIP37536.1 stage V sporulation protein AA [Paenibacillus sp. J31TS4]
MPIRGEEAVVYLRFRKRVRCEPGDVIELGAVAQLQCEPGLEERLRRLPIRLPQPKDGNMVLIDALYVIRHIRRSFPGLQLELYGEPHALVEIAGRERPAHPLVIALVWLLLFIGSGMAIMNFHADVSMLEVHKRIYELLTGSDSERPYLLQIPYSFGIGIGMILFFNHLFKKKFNEEPSPLEVEMFLYQENMNHYIITEEYAKLADEEGGEQPHSVSEGGRGGSNP